VEVGDRVAAGQAVATLDDREYRLADEAATAALAELDVRLGQLRRDLERAERLEAARAATAEEVEQVRSVVAALEAARLAATARRDEAARLRGEAVLRAPFDATVTGVMVEPGEWVAPGRTIVELAGRGGVEVTVEVPEGLRHRVAPGSRVVVSLPFLDREVSGEVSRVADAAQGAGSLFPVEVTLEPDDGLVAGLAAEVVLVLGGACELTVPLAAVVDPGGGRPAVFRVAGGRAERVPVRPGRVVGDRLTVDGELRAGDAVAVSGHTALADRDLVEVL
jgi:RND family efflux transporter MFP subunit